MFAGDNHFSTLFEFLPIGAYRSTPQGELLRANPALWRLNGLTTEAEHLAAARGEMGAWYVDPHRHVEFLAILARDGRVVGFESEVYRLVGRERLWVRENAHRVHDEQGQPTYYEGTVEDITDRVRARDALRESQLQLSQILEMIPGMVYRVELLPEGRRRPTFISQGVQALLGLTPAEVVADGRLMHRLRHPEDRVRIEAETDRANTQRLPLQTDFRIVLPDGQMKWVRLLSAPAPSPEGVQARVGMVMDITASKQAETLRLERDRAAAADLAKSEFLSRASHELRTPLHAILGFAQLLEMDNGEGAFRERQRAWTRQVQASGQHLLALMNDLLDLSSAQTGRLPVNIESVDLMQVLDEAQVMLGSVAQAAGITLKSAPVQSALPRVRGDHKRLLQVVCNLLSNAIKYNSSGGWVRLQVHTSSHVSGATVVLGVADSGPGLSTAQQARLFQPFERLGAQRGPVAGTGLGLALSRQLVEAMGGTIAVDTHPGNGAIFLVRLPVFTADLECDFSGELGG